jgi:hypothetical protein
MEHIKTPQDRMQYLLAILPFDTPVTFAAILENVVEVWTLKDGRCPSHSMLGKWIVVALHELFLAHLIESGYAEGESRKRYWRCTPAQIQQHKADEMAIQAGGPRAAAQIHTNRQIAGMDNVVALRRK